MVPHILYRAAVVGVALGATFLSGARSIEVPLAVKGDSLAASHCETAGCKVPLLRYDTSVLSSDGGLTEAVRIEM